MSKKSEKLNQLHEDKFFMNKVLELAKQGKGLVNPNPLVGAVIVQKGKIIGQGYHQKFGGAHAEINAIKNCHEPILNATLYVNLEPCAHQGKTPSCAKEIIKHDFKRVVIAVIDPNPLVAGKGVQILEEAGIHVNVGVLEEKARKVNQFFFKYIQTKKPFVMIKSAMSLDGKIATHSGESKWISSARSRQMVHDLRHEYSAILTGVNTIIKDNPTLNTRNSSSNPSHPVRVVLDPKGRIPLTSKVLNTRQFGKTIIVISDTTDIRKTEQLKEKTEIIHCREINNQLDLKYLIQKLGEMGLDSVMVEAGGSTNFECIRQNIVDKILLFVSPQIIGGRDAITAFEGLGFDKLSEARKIKKLHYQNIGNDLLIEAKM